MTKKKLLNQLGAKQKNREKQKGGGGSLQDSPSRGTAVKTKQRKGTKENSQNSIEEGRKKERSLGTQS